MENNSRDAMFRQWYDAREGTKSESFAYDVWCAAWEAAIVSSDAEYLDKLITKITNALG